MLSCRHVPLCPLCRPAQRAPVRVQTHSTHIRPRYSRYIPASPTSAAHGRLFSRTRTWTTACPAAVGRAPPVAVVVGASFPVNHRRCQAHLLLLAIPVLTEPVPSRAAVASLVIARPLTRLPLETPGLLNNHHVHDLPIDVHLDRLLFDCFATPVASPQTYSD